MGGRGLASGPHPPPLDRHPLAARRLLDGLAGASVDPQKSKVLAAGELQDASERRRVRSPAVLAVVRLDRGDRVLPAARDDDASTCGDRVAIPVHVFTVVSSATNPSGTVAKITGVSYACPVFRPTWRISENGPWPDFANGVVIRLRV